MPTDIEFQDEKETGRMSVSAGGHPDNILKIGNGWFFHFAKSILEASEINNGS